MKYHKKKYPKVKTENNEAYPSELNKIEAIPINGDSKKITKIFNYLLTKDIPLVQFGKGDSFMYL